MYNKSTAMNLRNTPEIKSDKQLNMNNYDKNIELYNLMFQYSKLEDKNYFIELLTKLSYFDLLEDNLDKNYLADEFIEYLPMEDIIGMSHEDLVDYKIKTLKEYLAVNKKSFVKIDKK